MEPITSAILAAIAKLAEPAIKDAYDGLKALIVRKLGAQNAISDSIQHVERDPEKKGRRASLAEELLASPVAADQEVLAQARALLELVQSRSGQGSATHVTQTVTGSGNVVLGTGTLTVNHSRD